MKTAITCFGLLLSIASLATPVGRIETDELVRRAMVAGYSEFMKSP